MKGLPTIGAYNDDLKTIAILPSVDSFTTGERSAVKCALEICDARRIGTIRGLTSISTCSTVPSDRNLH